MSYQDGWDAINLRMPKRVPRTEYSASEHWELIQTVSGMPVTVSSDGATKRQAQQAFHRAWNFDFFWSTMVDAKEFGNVRTSMGHAVYAAGWNAQVSSLFAEPEQVLAFDPWAALGTRDQKAITRRFEEHYRRNVEEHPDGVNMTGIYITCVSGLIDLFGWDLLLLAAGTDPVEFGKLTDRYASWIQQYFDALAAANVPVVMVHDDIVWTSGPFIAPAWYRQHVFPHYQKFFAPLRDSGKKIMFTSDGDYTMFVDDIAACGMHAFVMEPTTDMQYVADKYGQTHAFIGNADTRILLSGTKAEIHAEVERCMAIGKKYPGFFMAVGNHIPANTPVENALYDNQVYEELSCR
jgi:hypothetical protein